MTMIPLGGGMREEVAPGGDGRLATQSMGAGRWRSARLITGASCHRGRELAELAGR
jgi:hypothetical protein